MAKNDYSNAETYSKAQANPPATRLVVIGVAISFGVRRDARWTPSYFSAVSESLETPGKMSNVLLSFLA